jgi:hypothetical protein
MKSEYSPRNLLFFFLLLIFILQCSYEKNPPQSARNFSEFKAQYTGQFVESSLTFTMEDGTTRCLYIYERPLYSDQLAPSLVTSNCDIKFQNSDLMEKRYCTFQTDSTQEFFTFKFGCKYAEDGQHFPCSLNNEVISTVAELGFDSEPAKTSDAYSSSSAFSSSDKATAVTITEGDNCS